MKCRYQRYLYSWYENGKRITSFSPVSGQRHSKDPSFHAELVPCGRCIACRVSKAHDWAVRGSLESYCHEQNSFITLTYDDEHLPKNLSVSKREFRKFVNRLREHIARKYGVEIRVLGSGEYGEKTERPHYHAIIFGFDFPDREPLYVTRGANAAVQYYISPLLSKVWKFGNHIIGEVNLTTINYTAKYVLKKVTGDKAKEHYGDREPEFGYYSRNPAIGRAFFEKHTSDFYPKDFITLDGKKHPIPRYFYKRLEKDFPELFSEVRYRKILKVAEEGVDLATGEITKDFVNAYQLNQDFDHSDKYLNHMAEKVAKMRSL